MSGGPIYEPMPEPRSGRGRGAKILVALGVLFVVGLVVAGGVALWVNRQVNPSGGPGQAISVQIPNGSSTQRIATILEKSGVVDSARVFRLYVKAKGGGPFQAGSYTLRRNEKFDQLISALEKGPKLTFQRLTVPEGLTIKQLAERVGKMPGRSAERFLEVLESGQVRSRYQPAGSNNLEGLLLPETYFVAPDEDEARILRRMVDAFDKLATELNISAAASRHGLTPYQAVIVASMIEREARVPEDRGPIAQVIYNRLERGMPLQIDATVLYALGVQKDVVLLKDLEVDSPYNTYRIPGLPPGPIAAPGRRALEAALNPTPGPYLYSVVIEENGRHAFAETLAEHNRNIAAAKAKGLN